MTLTLINRYYNIWICHLNSNIANTDGCRMLIIKVKFGSSKCKCFTVQVSVCVCVSVLLYYFIFNQDSLRDWVKQDTAAILHHFKSHKSRFFIYSFIFNKPASIHIPIPIMWWVSKMIFGQTDNVDSHWTSYAMMGPHPFLHTEAWHPSLIKNKLVF